MIPLLLVIVLGVILALTHGNYQPDCMIVLSTCFFGGILIITKYLRGFSLPTTRDWREGIILLGLILFSLLLSFDNELLYSEPSVFSHFIRRISLASSAFVIMGAGITWFGNQNIQKWSNFSFALAFLCLLFAKLVVPLASPKPFIDVFWINSWAASDFIKGLNPYSQTYADIYHGAYGYQPGFTYWPFFLFNITVFKILGIDIRYLNLLAEIIIAIIIVFFLRGTKQKYICWPIVLVWFSLPTSLFVLEQAWVDNVLLAWMGISFIFYYHKKNILCGMAIAFAASTKQYGFIPGLILASAILSRDGLKSGLYFMLTSTLTWVAIVCPFIFWDPLNFYKNTIDILIRIPMRNDSLSLPAFIANQWSYIIPGWILVISYLLILLIAALIAAKNAKNSGAVFAGIGLCYLWIFIFGKQASCNYYTLALGIILIAISADLKYKNET
jgi:hypothetical protein